MARVDDVLSNNGKVNNVISTSERDDMTAMHLALFAVSILLARGSTDIAAQTVLIAHDTSRSRDASSAGSGKGSMKTVYLIGDSTFDVEPGDRFKYNGVAFDVTAVQSDVPGRIRAEAEQVQ